MRNPKSGERNGVITPFQGPVGSDVADTARNSRCCVASSAHDAIQRPESTSYNIRGSFGVVSESVFAGSTRIQKLDMFICCTTFPDALSCTMKEPSAKSTTCLNPTAPVVSGPLLYPGPDSPGKDISTR